MGNHSYFESEDSGESFSRVGVWTGTVATQWFIRRMWGFFPEWSVQSRCHPLMMCKRKWISFQTSSVNRECQVKIQAFFKIGSMKFLPTPWMTVLVAVFWRSVLGLKLRQRWRGVVLAECRPMFLQVVPKQQVYGVPPVQFHRYQYPSDTSSNQQSLQKYPIPGQCRPRSSCNCHTNHWCWSFPCRLRCTTMVSFHKTAELRAARMVFELVPATNYGQNDFGRIGGGEDNGPE